jgi:hypothetical protein
VNLSPAPAPARQVPVVGGFRNQRFNVGDIVSLDAYNRGLWGDVGSMVIREVILDPLPQHVPGSGNSAQYVTTNPRMPVVWDWQLS